MTRAISQGYRGDIYCAVVRSFGKYCFFANRDVGQLSDDLSDMWERRSSSEDTIHRVVRYCGINGNAVGVLARELNRAENSGGVNVRRLKRLFK